MTRLKHRLTVLIKYVILLAFGLYGGTALKGYQTVVDGDTLKIGRQTVRMNGIDAPELKQNCLCKGKTVRCGLAARKELHRLIGSETVFCETSGRDLYGRLLAECFIWKNHEKINLNELMIKHGLAMAKYSKRFLLPESEAISNRRGFWDCEGFEDPSFFRKTD